MENSIQNVVGMGDCTGCGVCAIKCPNGAITIGVDEEGFLSPIMDENKCTNCGICTKVCSAINCKSKNAANPECYALMAENDVRRISSSGGMFTLLAKVFFELGGYVCGAAYTKDWNVHHIIIDNENDLDKLRRSKYVQSEMGDTYLQIKNLLEDGKYVLFTGTPCQVSALKSFLNKEYEKLLTVDIVCHGVPSYTVFRKFLDEIADINDIKAINFRDKERIGLDCLFSLQTNKEKTYPQEFFFGFVNNLFLRKSCTSCKYTGFRRQGDMTIGDFWNISKYDAELDDRIGTSLVLVNNKKGQDYFNKVKEQSIKFKKMDLTHIDEERNPTFYYPSVVHPNRERFFRLFKKRKYSDAYELSLCSKYDIGLVGCGFSNNYGAILTNYALYKTLEDLNQEVLVIDKPRMLTSVLFNDYHYTDTIARKFMNKYFNVSNIYQNTYDLRELNNICKNFVVGSDQIWNTGVNTPCYYYYFLDWVFNSRKKIAYASSFGNDSICYPEDAKYNIKSLIKEFDAISVRENSGVDICKNEFGVDAVHNLDPVFITDKKHYDELISNSSFDPDEENYIAAYILDSKKNHIDILNYMENKLGMKSYCFTDLTNDGTNIESTKNVLKDAETETFLKVFKNSKFVVTNSFHGVCFSIIFNKPFICIPNRYRGFARFDSILTLLNLKDRIVESIEDLENFADLSIDYTQVNKILEEEKTKSLNWLKEAINSDKQKSPTTNDYINIQLSELVSEINVLKNSISNLNEQNRMLNEYNRELSEQNNTLRTQNKISAYKQKLFLYKTKIIKKYQLYSVLRFITFGKNEKIRTTYDDLKSLVKDIKHEENLLEL